MIDDVPVLEPGESGGDQFLFDARPNLGREVAAAASKEVGVLLDHDRSIGATDERTIANDLHPRFRLGLLGGLLGLFYLRGLISLFLLGSRLSLCRRLLASVIVAAGRQQ